MSTHRINFYGEIRKKSVLFSSPEQEVLKVSYCDQSVSVVRCAS